MKSFAFLRKTWKKWTVYHRGDEQINGRWCEPQKSVSPSSSISQPNSCHSPSQYRDDRPILHRNISRFAIDTAHRVQDSPTTSLEPAIHNCDQLLTSATNPSKKPNSSCTLSPKDADDSVPHHESLSVYRVSQPLNVSDDLGSSTSHCLTGKHPYISTNQARSTDTILSTTSSDEVQYPQNVPHTALDIADAKPRTLYHTTRSMPYLPYEGEIESTQTCSASSVVSSVDASEDKFPLSLFPTPPSLIVRKKIPPPLLLHNSSLVASPQSSCDSTPVGTPTTPRFMSPRSPSQSIFGSCKRVDLGRRVAPISPPSFSPPNSPLPSPPYYEDSGRPLDHAGRPLRSAYSTSNLKDALPLPAAHRLTFSESISNQTSLPIKKSRKPRPEGMQPERLQACLEAAEQGSLTPVENNVQWGYAF